MNEATTTALAKRNDDGKARDLAFDLLRASGFGLLRGRILVPTPRLVGIARDALKKVKAVESLELVPAEGEVRMHLVLQMMGNATRVVVRVGIASFFMNERGGALRLRLLEAPTFAGRNGGKSGGVLGMIGAFGEAALSSMGPEKILATVAEFLGGPLKAKGDMLTIDLGSIPAISRALEKETVVGRVGQVVNISGASFRPGGLEVSVAIQRKPIFEKLSRRLFG